MSLVRSVLTIPAVASALWVARPVSSDQSNDINRVAISSYSSGESSTERPMEKVRTTATEQAVMGRKIRIQKLLTTLDRVAEISMQMSPERSSTLEPVIVDLAERTLELTSNDTVRNDSTDQKLGQLELTLDRLVGVLGKIVEPEVSL
jgi:hypothetical protein